MRLATPSYFSGMSLKLRERNISNKHNRLKNPNWWARGKPIGYFNKTSMSEELN